MNEFHDGVIRKAGDLITELRGSFDPDDLDQAIGLVVAVTDPDGGPMRCHGPFPDPVAATAWAESYTGLLNSAVPGAPFRSQVHLLFDPHA